MNLFYFFLQYSTQKKTIETELEKIREELRQHLEQFEKVNLENNSLLRSKTELTMKLETVENEVSELNELILVLREEKAHLEKALVDAQKSKATIQEEKNDLLRQLGSETSSISNLQGKYVYFKKMLEVIPYFSASMHFLVSY